MTFKGNQRNFCILVRKGFFSWGLPSDHKSGEMLLKRVISVKGLGQQPEQKGLGRGLKCGNWRPRDNCIWCVTECCDKKKRSELGQRKH